MQSPNAAHQLHVREGQEPGPDLRAHILASKLSSVPASASCTTSTGTIPTSSMASLVATCIAQLASMKRLAAMCVASLQRCHSGQSHCELPWSWHRDLPEGRPALLLFTGNGQGSSNCFALSLTRCAATSSAGARSCRRSARSGERTAHWRRPAQALRATWTQTGSGNADFVCMRVRVPVNACVPAGLRLCLCLCLLIPEAPIPKNNSAEDFGRHVNYRE